MTDDTANQIGFLYTGGCWDATGTDTLTYSIAFIDQNNPNLSPGNSNGMWWLSPVADDGSEIAPLLQFNNQGPNGLTMSFYNYDVASGDTGLNYLAAGPNYSSLYVPTDWHDITYSITGDGTGNYSIDWTITNLNTGVQIANSVLEGATYSIFNASLAQDSCVDIWWCSKGQGHSDGNFALPVLQVPEPGRPLVLALVGALWLALGRSRSQVSPTAR